MISPSLQNFFKTGIKPSSDRDRSALLDEARSLFESIAAEAHNWTPPTRSAEVEQIKRNAEAAKAQREKAQRELEKQAAEASRKLSETRARDLAAAKKPAAVSPPATKPTPSVKTAPHTPAPNRFAGATESLVIQAATHRSSPEADRIEARRELEVRGIAISPDNVISRSIRGGRAAKLSK